MAALPVGAQLIGASALYQECMRQARRDPERGLETALAWKERLSANQPIVKVRDQRQDNAAAHCEAVSLIGLKQFVSAAKRLEGLAKTMTAEAPKTAKAEILAQAGQAWSGANKTAKAEKAQTAAIALSPDDAAFRIDRAITRASDGRYWDAVDDLNVAISLERGDAATYALRASAYRSLNVLSLAKQDVDAALRLAPDNEEALLEQGNVYHLMGDDARAREAWRTLIRAHDGAPSADAAQRNLTKLDNAEKPPN